MNATTIKEYLAGLVCKSMYMEREELDEEELFSDYGLESTTLVKILAKLNEKYTCNVKIEELIEHQTLKEASTYIHQKISN